MRVSLGTLMFLNTQCGDNEADKAIEELFKLLSSSNESLDPAAYYFNGKFETGLIYKENPCWG